MDVGFDKSFLQRVLRVGWVAQNPQSKPVAGRLVPINQFSVCDMVGIPRPFNELYVSEGIQ